MDTQHPVSNDSDIDLLQSYAGSGSEAAFHELVKRHAGWIHGVARRGINDEQLAEEITQTVFALLARKASSFDNSAKLAPWLFRAARYVTADARKRERRRRHHEEQAARMKPTINNDIDNSEWQKIAPELDSAVAALSPTDRQAILMRFYQRKPHADIARDLGVTESAAKMRLSRALEKLRTRLTRRGVAVSSIALSAILLDHAAASAPASVIASASACATSAATSSTLGKGALFIMTMNKATIAVGLALAALLMTGVTIAVKQNRSSAKPDSSGWTAGGTAIQLGVDRKAEFNSGWRERFEKVYAFTPADIVRRVPPPYIEERRDWIIDTTGGMPVSGTTEKTGPVAMELVFDARKPRVMRIRGITPSDLTLGEVLGWVLDAPGYDVSADPKLLSRQVTGDWIINQAVPVADRVAPLQRILREECGVAVGIERRRVPAEVIVVSGGATQTPTISVQVYSDRMDATPPGEGAFDRDFAAFLDSISGLTSRSVINESSVPAKAKFSWDAHESAWVYNMPPKRAAAKIDMILANVSKQTGLTLRREVRQTEKWFVSEQAAPNGAQK